MNPKKDKGPAALFCTTISFRPAAYLYAGKITPALQACIVLCYCKYPIHTKMTGITGMVITWDSACPFCCLL